MLPAPAVRASEIEALYPLGKVVMFQERWPHSGLRRVTQSHAVGLLSRPVLPGALCCCPQSPGPCLTLG